MKFGVVRFPGSCDEVDALLACRRFADAELLWHGDRDLDGVDAVVVPGGFSYGDYLRAGRDRALLAGRWRRSPSSRATGGPVLGICNGFQVLCEAGLLPGALLPNDSLRFVCRQVDVEVVNADTPFTRACARGRAALDPGQAHHRPLLRAGATRSTSSRRTARSCSATPRARTRTARCATSPACATASGNVMGLMPHPEHAVDPLTGSADGGVLFASLVAHVDELVATA